MRLSYRGAEELLRDGRAWCRAIGMRRGKTPDHSTLSRAAGVILSGRRGKPPAHGPPPRAGGVIRGGRGGGRVLALLAEWFMLERLLGTTLAVDSTCCDTPPRSRHYERRLRHYGVGGRADRSADARR